MVVAGILSAIGWLIVVVAAILVVFGFLLGQRRR
jgi:hypothetical protein